MGKGQGGWRKVWKEMSGEGDLENRGRSRIEERGLGSGQHPGEGQKEEEDAAAGTNRANHSKHLN